MYIEQQHKYQLIVDRLTNEGSQITAKREVIIKHLCDTHDNIVDIEDFWLQIRNNHHAVSLSTVYTLFGILKRIGLLHRLEDKDCNYQRLYQLQIS